MGLPCHFSAEVGLDACMANLMRPGMYGAYHHITIIPNSEQMPELPDRKKDMPDNSKDLITKTGIYDVVGGWLSLGGWKLEVGWKAQMVKAPETSNVILLFSSHACELLSRSPPAKHSIASVIFPIRPMDSVFFR